MNWSYSLPRINDSEIPPQVGDENIPIRAHFEDGKEPFFYWVAVGAFSGVDRSDQCYQAPSGDLGA